MAVTRLCALVVALLVVPGLAWAAPEGRVVIAQGVDPTTLDMMNQQETPASNVGAQIFDTLVERDQSLKIIPALAAELPKLVTPTAWEIKLRKGVKFHNGEEFNAESVKFSPLWNFTPRRSLNSHVVGATSLGISAASAGTSLRF